MREGLAEGKAHVAAADDADLGGPRADAFVEIRGGHARDDAAAKLALHHSTVRLMPSRNGTVASKPSSSRARETSGTRRRVSSNPRGDDDSYGTSSIGDEEPTIPRIVSASSRTLISWAAPTMRGRSPCRAHS